MSSLGSHEMGTFGSLTSLRLTHGRLKVFHVEVTIAKPLGPSVGHGEEELRVPQFLVPALISG